MEIFANEYTLAKCYRDVSKVVPRGLFLGDNSQIALDYHAELLDIHEGDKVEIKLYDEKPDLKNAKTYLAYGQIGQIEEAGVEMFFGGLMLYYKGAIPEGMIDGADVYLSIIKC